LEILGIAARPVKYTGPVTLSGIEVSGEKKIYAAPSAITIKNVKKAVKKNKKNPNRASLLPLLLILQLLL